MQGDLETVKQFISLLEEEKQIECLDYPVYKLQKGGKLNEYNTK